MSGWEWRPIGDLVETVQSWSPLREEPDETFQYIDLSAIDQDEKAIVGAREVACYEAPSRARQLVEPNDVLVSTVRPNLNGVARVPAELNGATASTGFCVLRPVADALHSSYVFHWVKSPQFIADMVKKATGASYPAVSDRIVLASQIPHPPLQEQRRIAAILDQADALRTKRRETLAQLDSLTQAIFIEMFGDPTTNPQRWPRMMLGELVASGPQNGLYKPATDYGSGTPILRIDSFYDGIVTKLDSLKRVRLSESEKNLYGLSANDIIINRVNSREYLGKSAVIPKLAEPIVFESNLMRLVVERELAEPEYVIQFLQTSFIKDQISAAAKDAVNQSSINQRDVKGFLINVPPLALQQKFIRRVATVAKLSNACRISQLRFNALFASLQNRAFRGEL